MSDETKQIKLWVHSRQGHVSSTHFMDQALTDQVVRIARMTAGEPDEVIEAIVRRWLKSADGRRTMENVEGREDIEKNGGHDMDEVIAELEAIVRGDDPGDDDDG
jgi:hypothetical protein